MWKSNKRAYVPKLYLWKRFKFWIHKREIVETAKMMGVKPHQVVPPSLASKFGWSAKMLNKLRRL